jgi:serine/threonine protein kinase
MYEDAREAANPAWLQRGDHVGPYEVQMLVGRGGFGAIYKAVRDGRAFALKIPVARTAAVSASERHALEERIEREVASLITLRHPNIVRVHGFDRWPHAESGFLYIVMDFIEGVPLYAWLGEKRPSLKVIFGVFGKIALALDEMHRRGIFHRDLKSENVLVRATDDEPVIVDFGIARHRHGHELTVGNVLLGTPSHFAPEYVEFFESEGWEKGERFAFEAPAELHCVGFMLYESLTGVPPFASDAELNTLEQIVRRVPAAISKVNPRVPAEVDALLAKLLAKKPGDRFQSGADLAVALSAFLENAGADPAWEQPFEVLPERELRGETTAGERPARPVANHVDEPAADRAAGSTATATATAAAPVRQPKSQPVAPHDILEDQPASARRAAPPALQAPPRPKTPALVPAAPPAAQPRPEPKPQAQPENVAHAGIVEDRPENVRDFPAKPPTAAPRPHAPPAPPNPPPHRATAALPPVAGAGNPPAPAGQPPRSFSVPEVKGTAFQWSDAAPAPAEAAPKKPGLETEIRRGKENLDRAASAAATGQKKTLFAVVIGFMVVFGILALAAIGGRPKRVNQPESLLAKVRKEEAALGDAGRDETDSSSVGSQAAANSFVTTVALPRASVPREPTLIYEPSADELREIQRGGHLNRSGPADAPLVDGGTDAGALAPPPGPSWLLRASRPSPAKPDAGQLLGVPLGAHIPARLVTNLDSRTVADGPTEATLTRPFFVAGDLVLPSRTMLYGEANATAAGRFTIRFAKLRLPDNQVVAVKGVAFDAADKKPGLPVSRRIAGPPPQGDSLLTKVVKATASEALAQVQGNAGADTARQAGQTVLDNPSPTSIGGGTGDVLLLDAGLDFDVFVSEGF